MLYCPSVTNRSAEDKEPIDGTPRTERPAFLQRRGYWLAHWTEAGLNHWAVTDASEDALRDFVDRWCPPRDGKTP